MPARRMAGDIDSARITAELIGVFVNPGDGTAHLCGHGHQVAGNVVDIVEVDDDAVPAGVHDRFGIERKVRRPAVPPGAAMDVDVDRRVRGLATVDVHAFDLAPSILEPSRLANSGES